MRRHGAMRNAPLLRRPLGLAAGDNYSDFRVRVPGWLAGREENQMPFKNLVEIIPLEGVNELLLGVRVIFPAGQAEHGAVMQFPILKEYFAIWEFVGDKEIVELAQRAIKRPHKADIGMQCGVRAVPPPNLVLISDGDLLIG